MIDSDLQLTQAQLAGVLMGVSALLLLPRVLLYPVRYLRTRRFVGDLPPGHEVTSSASSAARGLSATVFLAFVHVWAVWMGTGAIMGLLFATLSPGGYEELIWPLIPLLLMAAPIAVARLVRRIRLGTGVTSPLLPFAHPGGFGRAFLTLSAALLSFLLAGVVLLLLYQAFFIFVFDTPSPGVQIYLGPDGVAAFGEEGLNGLAALQVMIAVALLGLVPLLILLFRRATALNAKTVRSADTRPPVVYLRGFRDDKRKIYASPSARRPLIELLVPVTRDRFEVALCWLADAVGPTIAVSLPGGGLPKVGAAREVIPPTDAWLDVVRTWLADASLVIWSLGDSEGLLRELREICRSGLWSKTIIVVPPVSAKERRRRWEVVMHTLRSEGLMTPPGSPDNALTGFVVDGRLHVVDSPRTDEVGYQAAFVRASERRVGAVA